jgi:hypothetical protein
MLNKAIRVQNIDVLFLFRFFIVDIQEQLNIHRCSSPIRLYRGQVMSKEEVEMLKNLIDQFVSFNQY